MSKNLRTFKARTNSEGCVIYNSKLTHSIGGYYLKYTFGNDVYQTIYNSFTKEDEYSIDQYNNLETFYNATEKIGTLVTANRPYTKIFQQFQSFIDEQTLEYDDHIDATYTLYIYVEDETANTYSTFFEDSRVFETTIANFADYLYYSVLGRQVRYPEMVITEFFDVAAYLATL